MRKPNLANLMSNTRQFANKHSPEILTGIGIAGMITTTVLAVRATPKALELLEEKKNEDWVDELSPLEVVKAAWKPYVPAAVTGIASVACLIGASSVNAKRNAALATAYKLSETALSEYREKVIETIGEKKEKTVRDKVAEERVKKNPVSKSEVVVTNNGTTLCFDPISARYFKSSIDKIKRAENELNKQMLHDISGYVSLNDFYDELGLDHTSVGDDLGWNVDRLIDISFSSQLNDNGEPSVVLDYLVAPKYDFYKFS
jgi:hypothetical protein